MPVREQLRFSLERCEVDASANAALSSECISAHPPPRKARNEQGLLKILKRSQCEAPGLHQARRLLLQGHTHICNVYNHVGHVSKLASQNFFFSIFLVEALASVHICLDDRAC